MAPPTNWLIDRPESAPIAWFLFAHGAGAPMDSDFMRAMAELLVEQGLGVIRFEFPYMAERRQTGKRRPPNKMDVLLTSFQAQIDRAETEFPGVPLYIGGKSMGGRVASLLVQENADGGRVAGAVCLGYPFHPPGKPEKLRTGHLAPMTCPTLIIQGTRDKLGSREEVAEYPLGSGIQLYWLEDGDHDFKPRKVSGFTQQQHWQTAAAQVHRWLHPQGS
ncbi:alpha/beta family hydrolase [Microbulbifer elongatus]|uniref:alpha/beta family hydrolase n=1 Tax=Microbulbifer elongatus TaxID=86173 RepID=UPI001E467E78|nr:alpha/beta family hydrolase [Microbulbifer elongatus]